MTSTHTLLKDLTEAHGVPGYETPVRAVARKYLQPLGKLTQDKLGSLICQKSGTAENPRVMMAGHMDEIGFMVKHITKEGFLKFLPLGGWFDQVLLGQRVSVKTTSGDVLGVIGAKPPHLLSLAERKKVILKKDMYIDVGATSKQEVESIGIQPGDSVVPVSDFVRMAGEKALLSKAFDDRVGVALVVSALEHFQENQHPNKLFGVATVQEEVGLRGAITSVRAVNPDVAIILEIDIAGDVPGIKDEESSVKLGKGPTVVIYEARMIPNIKYRRLVTDIAAELNIPVQYSYIEGGATDGGAIHIHDTGVPTVVLGVPARHIHSHNSIIHEDDYENTVKLLIALIERLDSETVKELTI